MFIQTTLVLVIIINDYCLKSQVLTAGGWPVQWLNLSYLVYDKASCSQVRSTHGTEESDHNKINKINKYRDFIQWLFLFSSYNVLICILKSCINIAGKDDQIPKTDRGPSPWSLFRIFVKWTCFLKHDNGIPFNTKLLSLSNIFS